MRLLLLSLALVSARAQSRAPVLVELFTSEGCSSCPPADRLLEQLDSRVVVLSEHVDYWNHDGWKDPYSSHEWTERQERYGRIFNLQSAYTPEMIVDGESEFVGNDAARASAEISRASRKKKAEIRLTRSEAGLHIEVTGSPSNADVFLAFAEDHGMNNVSAGENKGRQLRHVAMVRSLQKIGSVKRAAEFTRDIELPRSAEGKRVIVFVQESGPGRVDGAAVWPAQ